MKKTLWTMAAALALVGCSQDDLMNMENTQVQEQNAIAFSTYVGDNAQSRAAIVDDPYIKANGFTVNAYYTGSNTFEDATTEDYEGTFQLFMDNTKLTFNPDKGDDGEWTYSPLKYWPNNKGDKLSFFAYAPYKSSQIVLDGENRSTLSFTVADDVKNQVDLIYHKANGDESEQGKTIDMEKQSVTDKVKFNFQHALSRITFDVKAVVDETDAENGDNLLDGNTRINIRSVQLVKTEEASEDPFYTYGTLNLMTGEWTADGTQPFVLEDDHFYQGVNVDGTDVVQLTKFNPEQPLLNEDSYLMIIPQNFTDTEGYRIYIVYDVISEKVENNGSSANSTHDGNTITNYIYSEPLKTNFVAGQAYKFTLLLGMTSVKFEAGVTDWLPETGSEEWMPENSKGTPGTANNPYLITSLADLEQMVSDINAGNTPVEGGVAAANAYYLQTATIDMSEKYYENSENTWSGVYEDFSGTYDGGGFEIQKFYGNDGIFEKLTETGVVKSVKITEGTIPSLPTYEGGIVSKNYGTVLDCSFSGNVGNNGSYAGAIVGATYGDVIHCYFDGEMTGDGDESGWTGAVVGETYEDARVIACYNKGTITGESIGAVIGYHSSDYDVTKEIVSKAIACYNIGTVTTTCNYNVAPISGINNGNDTCIGCYNTGELTSNSKYGTSYISDGLNSACYYDATSGQKSTTYLNDDDGTVDHPTEIGVDRTDVTWEQAMEAMNAAIIAELGEDTPYIFVLNTDETTKEKMPLIHKVDSPAE